MNVLRRIAQWRKCNGETLTNFEPIYIDPFMVRVTVQVGYSHSMFLLSLANDQREDEGAIDVFAETIGRKVSHVIRERIGKGIDA